MPIALDLTERELWYCKLLAKGQVEFDELDFEEKLLVYEMNVDITDAVPKEDIREFEEALALKNYFGPGELAKTAARRAAGRVIP